MTRPGVSLQLKIQSSRITRPLQQGRGQGGWAGMGCPHTGAQQPGPPRALHTLERILRTC